MLVNCCRYQAADKFCSSLIIQYKLRLHQKPSPA